MQESLNFDASWRAKVTDYEAAVATQLCSLKQQHETQMTEMLMRCEAGRPSRPQHSAEILNGRKIEEALVKQVCGATITVERGSSARAMCMCMCMGSDLACSLTCWLPKAGSG